MKCRAAALPILLLAVLASGCASTLPERFYVIDLGSSAIPVVSQRYDAAVTLMLDELPVEVDRPELTLRDGSHGVVVREGDRWAAPLSDTLRRALVLGLGRALPAAWIGTSDVGDAPVRLQVRIERLELDRAGHASLAASWVSRAGDSRPRTGRLTLARQVGGADLAAGVDAWSGELAELAQAIARALAAADSTAAPGPPGPT